MYVGMNIQQNHSTFVCITCGLCCNKYSYRFILIPKWFYGVFCICNHVLRELEWLWECNVRPASSLRAWFVYRLLTQVDKDEVFPEEPAVQITCWSARLGHMTPHSTTKFPIACKMTRMDCTAIPITVFKTNFPIISLWMRCTKSMYSLFDISSLGVQLESLPASVKGLHGQHSYFQALCYGFA